MSAMRPAKVLPSTAIEFIHVGGSAVSRGQAQMLQQLAFSNTKLKVTRPPATWLRPSTGKLVPFVSSALGRTGKASAHGANIMSGDDGDERMVVET